MGLTREGPSLGVQKASFPVSQPAAHAPKAWVPEPPPGSRPLPWIRRARPSRTGSLSPHPKCPVDSELSLLVPDIFSPSGRAARAAAWGSVTREARGGCRDPRTRMGRGRCRRAALADSRYAAAGP